MGQQVIIELSTGEQFGVAIEAARKLYPDATVLTNADGSPYRPAANLSQAGALAGELDNPVTKADDADIAAEEARLAAAQEPVAAPEAAEAGKAAPEATPPPDGA